MIVEFDIDTDCWQFHHNEGKNAKHRLNCFDCTWLSDYVSEQEIFFIGATYKFVLNTIIETVSAQNYEKYVKGLRQMTYCMSKGSGIYEKHNIPTTKKELQMVFRLLSHQIWTYYPNHPYAYEFKNCPDYFKHILHSHCKCIKIISFTGVYSKIHDSLLRYDNGWINLELVMTLFPNAITVRCDGLIKDNMSFIKPSIICESVLKYLKNNKYIKLEDIKIEVTAYFLML
eukprot:71561_1